jgi:RNA polymerase sigma-70 factor (ECF subfamily)
MTYSQQVVNIEDRKLKDIPDKYGNVEKYVTISEEKRLVFKEIKKLPEAQQVVLILHDIEDMTYEEISQVASCPVGTVKSRLFNARKTLKEKLRSVITSINIS